jgi:hypothetical protein
VQSFYKSIRLPGTFHCFKSTLVKMIKPVGDAALRFNARQLNIDILERFNPKCPVPVSRTWRITFDKWQPGLTLEKVAEISRVCFFGVDGEIAQDAIGSYVFKIMLG